MEITTALHAYTSLREIASVDTEEFWVLALGPKKNLIRCKMLFRGTVDSCLVHPRDIFRFAYTENASSLIVAHNHPSGDPQPSTEDILFTRRLVRASDLLQVPILDHLIITQDAYTSLARSGLCRFSKNKSLYLGESKALAGRPSYFTAPECESCPAPARPADCDCGIRWTSTRPSESTRTR